MSDRAPEGTSASRPTGIPVEPGIPICQADYPIDRYQEEFVPYAEEFLSLPDRTPESVLPWMESYLEPALSHFGDSLLLLAHYYMGGGDRAARRALRGARGGQLPTRARRS